MSKGNVDAFLKALFHREAGTNTEIINYAGYIGKYQFGESAMIDLGYYTADGTNKNDWSGSWTGKHGIETQNDFLDSEAAQDVAAKEWISLLCKRMKKMKLNAYIGQTMKGIMITESGIIAGAHLKGFGSASHPGVAQFLRSNGAVDAQDGLNTSVSHYVSLLANYDLGCCNKITVVFAEKKTGAPIPGLHVQVRKNGKPHTTVKTDDHGFLPMLHGFSVGDQYEVLVAKLTGGFKSLKTGLMSDMDATLTFLSPKARTTTTTETHKGAPPGKKAGGSAPQRVGEVPAIVAPSPRPAQRSNTTMLTKPAKAQHVELPTPVTESTAEAKLDNMREEQPDERRASASVAPFIPDKLDIDSALWDQLEGIGPVPASDPDKLQEGANVAPEMETKPQVSSNIQTATLRQFASQEKTPTEATPELVAKAKTESTPDSAQSSKSATASPVKNISTASTNVDAEKTRSARGHPKAIAKKSAPLPKAKPPETKIQKTFAGLLFPLEKRPVQSYHDGARRFGSSRSGGTRKHAGIDLYAPVGTPVRAMEAGKVIQVYEFYAGTWVIEVDHGDFIARYGEVSKQGIVVKALEEVKRGQVLGTVGKLTGISFSMLHLEMYGTTENPAQRGKGLTQKGNPPFQRRNDLINPTESIDQSVLE